MTKMDIDNIAEQSQLYLCESNREKLKFDADSIISFVSDVLNVDTTGVEPTVHLTSLCNVFREDEVHDSYPREEIQKNAKTKDESYFLVPKVLE